MPSIVPVRIGPVTFHATYYDELISNPSDPFHVGRLPRDLPCHGLWHYYILAYQNWKNAQENLVYEDERSRFFDVRKARTLLENISIQYGAAPAQLVRYWDAVDAQRRALGFTQNADLPHEFRFRFN